MFATVQITPRLLQLQPAMHVRGLSVEQATSLRLQYRQFFSTVHHKNGVKLMVQPNQVWELLSQFKRSFIWKMSFWYLLLHIIWYYDCFCCRVGSIVLRLHQCPCLDCNWRCQWPFNQVSVTSSFSSQYWVTLHK